MIPFLLLPVPPIRDALAAMLAGRRGRVWTLVAGACLAGIVLHLASGHLSWYYVMLWPICGLAATAAAGVGEAGEPPPGRMLLVALPIAILAGVWDAGLQVRVPGEMDRGMPYFAALDFALLLLLVARPVLTLDLRYRLSWRDAGTVAVAVLALLVAALPVGYLVGFLRFNVRWISLPYATGRLIGLVMFVGLPEELLFRGMVQEALTRLWGERRGWITASALFGLTHIFKHAWRGSVLASLAALNWRYALLAALAGLAYGWVYRRTGRLGAAALTHGLVDWLWGTFLLVP
jgi:membrane protease YdiL (CAAX protease family)